MLLAFALVLLLSCRWFGFTLSSRQFVVVFLSTVGRWGFALLFVRLLSRKREVSGVFDVFLVILVSLLIILEV